MPTTYSYATAPTWAPDAAAPPQGWTIMQMLGPLANPRPEIGFPGIQLDPNNLKASWDSQAAKFGYDNFEGTLRYLFPKAPASFIQKAATDNAFSTRQGIPDEYQKDQGSGLGEYLSVLGTFAGLIGGANAFSNFLTSPGGSTLANVLGADAGTVLEGGVGPTFDLPNTPLDTTLEGGVGPTFDIPNTPLDVPTPTLPGGPGGGTPGTPIGEPGGVPGGPSGDPGGSGPPGTPPGTPVTPTTPGFLDRLLNGNLTADDIAKLAGLGLGGAATYLGANQQAEVAREQMALAKEYADKYIGFGAPYRARAEAALTPGFDITSIPGYKGALDTTSKNLLAHLSATNGNPFGNPGGLIEANKAIVSGTALPAYQTYVNQNITGGGLGVPQASTFQNTAINALGAEGQANPLAQTLGYLGGQMTPKTDLASVLKQFGYQGLA